MDLKKITLNRASTEIFKDIDDNFETLTQEVQNIQDETLINVEAQLETLQTSIDNVSKIANNAIPKGDVKEIKLVSALPSSPTANVLYLVTD